VTAKIASGSTDVQVQDIEWVIICGGDSFGLVTGNLGTDDAGGTALGGAPVNADYLNGDDYEATDELAAGTTFKFDINLDPAGDDGGDCSTSLSVGDTIEMKMVVDGGGTTISELQIESVVSGKEVT